MRQLAADSRGGRPQLDRPERGPVVVQQAHAVRERALRAAAVSIGEPEQRLHVAELDPVDRNAELTERPCELELAPGYRA